MRLVYAAALFAVSASSAFAQMGTYFVIPGRPDVPIFENGVDVSWSVVEGEYGLNRPNIVNPTIIYRTPPVIAPYPGRAAIGPSYFPHDGTRPGYGRLEVIPPPNRPLPRPAEGYVRGWRMESAPTPADLPPSNPPNMASPVIAPFIFPGAGGGGLGPMHR
jgi:hypothetical protein